MNITCWYGVYSISVPEREVKGNLTQDLFAKRGSFPAEGGISGNAGISVTDQKADNLSAEGGPEQRNGWKRGTAVPDAGYVSRIRNRFSFFSQ